MQTTTILATNTATVAVMRNFSIIRADSRGEYVAWVIGSFHDLVNEIEVYGGFQVTVQQHGDECIGEWNVGFWRDYYDDSVSEPPDVVFRGTGGDLAQFLAAAVDVCGIGLKCVAKPVYKVSTLQPFTLEF